MMKMKDKIVVDISKIMDEIFEAAESFSEAFQSGMGMGAQEMSRKFGWDENVDYYPTYSYPPANVFITKDKSLVFEFALAGFEEKNLNLKFQGDYMVFSASCEESANRDEEIRYFKHRLKFKDIEEQKYFVPDDKFDRENTKAVFKNGILRVSVPPKEEVTVPEGITIEIKKEED